MCWFSHDWIYSDMRTYIEMKRVLLTQFAPVEVGEYGIRTCKKCGRKEEKMGEHNYHPNWVQIEGGNDGST